MKLLLTSAGLYNETLRKTFLNLLNKNPKEVKLAFISTASNMEKNKSYVEEDLENLKKTGIEKIEDVDISKMGDKKRWLVILREADIIWVEGGNTFYLLYWFKKSSLDKEFKNILENKLYVGVSAGSILPGPSIEAAGWEPGGDKNIINLQDLAGLNLVSFAVIPHFEESQRKRLKQHIKSVSYPIYVLDNNMAVIVDEEKISLVGEGVGFKL